jgi:hypothetical protein
MFYISSKAQRVTNPYRVHCALQFPATPLPSTRNIHDPIHVALGFIPDLRTHHRALDQNPTPSNTLPPLAAKSCESPTVLTGGFCLTVLELVERLNITGLIRRSGKQREILLYKELQIPDWAWCCDKTVIKMCIVYINQ